MNGAQEVPPNSTTGSGTLSGTYDPVSYQVNYTVTWTGISGAPTGMLSASRWAD
ncbi:CHRD domain-containing protein [Chitinophaga sp.]|uniref:CHRD domain-containing protein n=1 Tax=Chitinophaga sp. TaxID=1869181 RepID=UPI0039C863BE